MMANAHPTTKSEQDRPTNTIQPQQRDRSQCECSGEELSDYERAEQQLQKEIDRLRPEHGFHALTIAREQNPELVAMMDADQEGLQRAKEKAAQREAEKRQEERIQHLESEWTKMAGRFADCRESNFVEHGEARERKAQRLIIAEL
ncbi:MAG: hypothetical protein KDA52_16020, partial [Planctomycetaceae bacterium]|nr:hypothetical protein [Planctomycetaceae bacterium]